MWMKKSTSNLNEGVLQPFMHMIMLRVYKDKMIDKGWLIDRGWRQIFLVLWMHQIRLISYHKRNKKLNKFQNDISLRKLICSWLINNQSKSKWSQTWVGPEYSSEIKKKRCESTL